jgi:hypothetical protein
MHETEFAVHVFILLLLVASIIAMATKWRAERRICAARFLRSTGTNDMLCGARTEKSREVS